MDVQDAAAEIALGNMPDSVLEEAAALPLPPSRLSRFLDSSLQRERMVSSRAASVLQSGQRTHTATPEFANASSASNNLNDSLVSPSLLPSIEQAEQSGCSRAPDDASQSSMSTHSLTLRPDVRIAQPNMSNSWRTAFSSNSGKGVCSYNMCILLNVCVHAHVCTRMCVYAHVCVRACVRACGVVISNSSVTELILKKTRTYRV